MITYGCSREEQPLLAERLRRIVAATGLPIRVGCHRGGFGVFVEWTVRGRGKESYRLRSAAHWALMDAETVLGLRQPGAYASTCHKCGATRANYDHTAAFCGALVQLANEFGVPLRIALAECAECHRRYLPPDPRVRALTGRCDRCYARLAIEP
jgi:hypothetical protein